QGNEFALNELSEQVYTELRRLANKYMLAERSNHTLQATSLVNEAFIRLVKAELSYQDRNHFFSLAGRMMRRILVDHARSIKRDKRGSGVQQLTLHESIIQNNDSPQSILDLHEALESLSEFDSRKAEILELQFFAGLTVKEIADVIKVSPRTVERDIQFAKAWLHQRLSSD
ncbi:MAG: sigma-70 family RNA polymerase sigma factor, partial [Proteobacteria bacterium]|nr:sigma-70 family RNA polymerase sigma factor [Pseudomonadota bacterium]